MTTLKNYYITVNSNEIHTYVYAVNAKDKDDAKQAWADGFAKLLDGESSYVDTISETIEQIEEA